MRIAACLKSIVVAFALAIPPMAVAHGSSNSSWYPSPTGWRGPIRDAGRPWLSGVAYPPATMTTYVSYSYDVPAWYAANQWYLDSSSGYYWMYDAQSGAYWYFEPASGQYFYSYAQH